MCTLLPRPFLLSQKSVLCLTCNFVSSWKNPFGSKWLDSVRTAKGYIVHFTSSPLSVVPKISLSPNPKSMLCFGRFQKGRPLLALVWILALLQNSQISQFGLFPPFSPSPLFARLLERSREFLNRVCQIGRLPANRGEPRISTHWACASQPRFPPLRAQFRFGVTTDWSRFRFLV